MQAQRDAAHEGAMLPRLSPESAAFQPYQLPQVALTTNTGRRRCFWC